MVVRNPHRSSFHFFRTISSLFLFPAFVLYLLVLLFMLLRSLLSS